MGYYMQLILTALVGGILVYMIHGGKYQETWQLFLYIIYLGWAGYLLFDTINRIIIKKKKNAQGQRKKILETSFLFIKFIKKLFSIAKWLLISLIYLVFCGVWVYFAIYLSLILLAFILYGIFNYQFGWAAESVEMFSINIEHRFGSIGVVLEFAFFGTLYPLYQWFFGHNLNFLNFLYPRLDDDVKK